MDDNSKKTVIVNKEHFFLRGSIEYSNPHLTVEELQEGYYWARHQLSSFNSIFKRTFHLRKSSLLYIPVNFLMRKASRATMKGALSSSTRQSINRR